MSGSFQQSRGQYSYPRSTVPALGSYQSYTAASKSSSFSQPAGRGSYSVAGTDDYSSYGQPGGYDASYQQNTAAAASTYDDNYDTSDSYYGQTETGYDTGDYGGYSSYNYPGGDYDDNSYTDYNTSTTAGSYVPGAGGSFGKPALYSGNAGPSTARASNFATGPSLQKPPLLTDEYYTSSSKPNMYTGYGGTGDSWSENWSNQQQQEGGEEEDYYGYSETGAEAGYDNYGDTAGGYDDYDSSYAGCPADEGYDVSSSSYYDSASNNGGGGDSWSAGPSGYGMVGRGSYSGTIPGLSQTASGGPSRGGSSGYQSRYGTPRFQGQTVGGTGFQAGRGGRLLSSPYGAAISEAEPRSGGGGTSYTSPNSVATGFTRGGSTATCTATQTFGTGGYPCGGSTSAKTSTTVSQRAPRVDGFTSFSAGAGSSLLGDPESSDNTSASQYSQFTESWPSHQSDEIPGILDSEYSTTSLRWSGQTAGTTDPQQFATGSRWSDPKPGLLEMQYSDSGSQWSKQKTGTSEPQQPTTGLHWSEQKPGIPGLLDIQYSTSSSRWSEQKPSTAVPQQCATGSRWSDPKPGLLDSTSRWTEQKPSTAVSQQSTTGSHWSDQGQPGIPGILDTQFSTTSSLWSDEKPDMSDEQYSTQFGESSRSRQADYTQGKAETTPTTRSSDYSGSRSTTRSLDYSATTPVTMQSLQLTASSHVVTTQSSTGAPQVFDYGHQDCDEDQAMRSSDRSYYLANINTARPPAKRKSSPSPEHRRFESGSSMRRDWRKSGDDMSSRRHETREHSQNVAGRRRSRDDREDTRDRGRTSTSYTSEKTSTSSSSGRQSSLVGHGRPAHDRWSATEPGGGSSSRSSSTGGRSFDPVKTSAAAVVKIPGLMDDVVTTVSSAKSAQVK